MQQNVSRPFQPFVIQRIFKAVDSQIDSFAFRQDGHWVIFNHCMPFDVTRCYDEATQYPDPRIWTAERDRAMWQALES